MRLPLLSFAVLAVTSLVSCDDDTAPNASLLLLAGAESDAFTRDPRPATLEVRVVSLSGKTQTLKTVPWPAGAVDLGAFDDGQTGALEAVGFDEAGNAVVAGRSVPLYLDQLGDGQLPLFMGRTGEMARPPGGLSSGRVGGLAEVVDGYLLITVGGDQVKGTDGASLSAAVASAYDCGMWAPLTARPEMPRLPKSLAVIGGRYGLLVDDAGATWVDFDTTLSEEADPPAGCSFADVAGGAALPALDGAVRLVGATRSQGAPTAATLGIASDLSLSSIPLSAPRLGAAAASMASGAIVVAGGAKDVAGVELIAPGASAAIPLPFAADPVSGAAAVALDASRVLLAGGRAPDGVLASPRIVDVSCAASCVAQPLDDDGDASVVGARLHALPGGGALLVGDAPEGAEDAGRTRVVLLTVSGQSLESSVIPLRSPRTGAISAMLPTGMPAVFGGLSQNGQPLLSFESFIPPQ